MLVRKYEADSEVETLVPPTLCNLTFCGTEVSTSEK